MWGLDASIPEGFLGAKAENIWKLHESGFKVPESIFVPKSAVINDALACAVLESFKQGHQRLVVRSSSQHEDGMKESMAGLFHSVLNVPAEPVALKQAMHDCRDHTPELSGLIDHGIGLVIQEMIEPRVSGLMFTEDPTDENSGIVLEWVEGHLEKLVQGEVEGIHTRVCRSSCQTGGTAIPQLSELQSLTNSVATLESITGGPADIEWAISGDDCYVLQIRPITSHQVGHLPSVTDLSLQQSYDTLPSRIRNHDKIAFREMCLSYSLPIAYGNLLAINPESDLEQIVNLHSGWGDSIAVLLTPQRISGEIQRISFHGNHPELLLSFIEAIRVVSPRFTALTKELQDTMYTGLALLNDDGSGEIEIGGGHFLSKGLTDPWRFKIEPNQVISLTNSPSKATSGIQIDEGTIQEDESAVEIPEKSQLLSVLDVLERIQSSYPKHCLEFGIEPSGTPFLIDHYPSEMRDASSNQVLSAGSFAGKVMRIEKDLVFHSIDSHFHDIREGNELVGVVLVADRPRLSLVKHLPDEEGMVGFLFEAGSRLCHLAVLLRERGIPAMFVGDRYGELQNGVQVSFETSTGLLSID